MENQAVSLEDVHRIVTTILEDPELVENKRRFYNVLGLPAGEFHDLARRARSSGSESYEFFTAAITKWIGIRGDSATFQEFVLTLRDENFNSVAEKLEKMRLGLTGRRKTFSEYVWFEVPEEIQYFAGRHAELNALHESITSLTNQNTTVITALSGLGGIGKTTLAVKYAWKYQTFFKNVIWINAQNEISMRDSFRRLAEHLKVKDTKTKWYESISAIYKFFQDKTSLFIFDNAESEIGISNVYLPPRATPLVQKPSILLTSRNNDWSEKFNIIPLHVFTQKESSEFLMNYLTIKDKSEFELAKKLYETLQGLPIAIRQAAAYIKSQKQTTKNTIVNCIRNYLEEFDANSKSCLSFEYWLKTGDTFRQTTFVTWNITLQKIKDNRLAFRIMRLISFWSPDHIPVQVFYFLKSKRLVHRTIKLILGKSLYEDTKEIRTAVNLLVQYSKLILTEDQELSIHRIVQTVIRENMSDRVKRKTVRESIYLVKTFLEIGTVTNNQKKFVFIHAESILVQANKLLPKHELDHFSNFLTDHRDTTIQMDVDFADELFRQEKYSEAVETYLIVQKMLLANVSRYNIQFSGLYVNMKLGHSYKMLGEFREAIARYDEVICALYRIGSKSMGNNFLHFSHFFYFTENEIAKMFVCRSECCEILGLPNEIPLYLKERIEFIRNDQSYGEMAYDVLHVASFFSYGEGKTKWLTLSSNSILSLPLLDKSTLIRRTKNGTAIQVNLLTRTWIKLFTSEEERTKYLKYCLQILMFLPPCESNISIWQISLDFMELVNEFPTIGVTACNFMPVFRTNYFEIIQRTVQTFKICMPQRYTEILDIICHSVLKVKKLNSSNIKLAIQLRSCLFDDSFGQNLQNLQPLVSCVTDLEKVNSIIKLLYGLNTNGCLEEKTRKLDKIKSALVLLILECQKFCDATLTQHSEDDLLRMRPKLNQFERQSLSEITRRRRASQ